jgi:hypothetical protein
MNNQLSNKSLLVPIKKKAKSEIRHSGKQGHAISMTETLLNKEK